MRRVYVAGAYSDDNVLGMLKNIGRGEAYAAALFSHGFFPFVPWHDKDFVLRYWYLQTDKKQFYEYSMAWLRVSEAVFVVPNTPGLRDWEDSPGTVKEIEEAKRLGIPVFHSIVELKDYFNI